MRADDVTIVTPDKRGRNSTRIQSYKMYNDSVIVLDLQHMPEGCGTWPIFFTKSPTLPWPGEGEIDVVEGTSIFAISGTQTYRVIGNNQNTQNLASMHTIPGCTMDQERSESGLVLISLFLFFFAISDFLRLSSPISNDCGTSVNNQGCGVSFAKPSSYGAPFNAVGGGFFVMARTQDEGVRIWFWTREDPAVPPEVRGVDGPYSVRFTMINPNLSWGLPEATFPVGDACEYDSHLGPHAIIFDLTFCVSHRYDDHLRLATI